MSTRWRTVRVVGAAILLLVACESRRDRITASAQANPYQTGSLDQILAPIALYPDSLLAQMLMSAGDPASVTKLDQWLKLNTALKGTQLQDEAVRAGFEPSFVALALFPQVVATMTQQITWTTRLGEVFAADRSAVFNSIQKLRAQAKSVGTFQALGDIGLSGASCVATSLKAAADASVSVNVSVSASASLNAG